MYVTVTLFYYSNMYLADVLFVFLLKIGLLSYFVHTAETVAVSNGTFTPAALTDLHLGDWRASASCPMSFNGHTFTANGAFIFTRFNTEITNFMHYLGNGNRALLEDTDHHRWIIASAQWGFSEFILYDFQFDYAGYLPYGPEGTCHIFSTLEDAIEMADTAEELHPAPRDELIDSCQYSEMDSSTSENGDYVMYMLKCDLTFSGWLGYNQGHILITFPFTVKSFTDQSGYAVINQAVDSTWYLLRVGHIIQSSITYNSMFERYKNVGSESQVYDIVVGLYASEADALTDVLSSSTTTQATTPTSTIPPPTTAISYSTTTSTLPPTTTSTLPPTTTSTLPPSTFNIPLTTTAMLSETTSTPTTTVVTTTVVPPIEILYTESGARKELKEFVNLANTIVDDVTSLWIHASPHLLRCARDCIADNQCVSIFYNILDKQCVAHSKVYGTVYQTKDGVRYYVIV